MARQVPGFGESARAAARAGLAQADTNVPDQLVGAFRAKSKWPSPNAAAPHSGGGCVLVRLELVDGPAWKSAG